MSFVVYSDAFLYATTIQKMLCVGRESAYLGSGVVVILTIVRTRRLVSPHGIIHAVRLNVTPNTLLLFIDPPHCACLLSRFTRKAMPRCYL